MRDKPAGKQVNLKGLPLEEEISQVWEKKGESIGVKFRAGPEGLQLALVGDTKGKKQWRMKKVLVTI